MPIWSQLGGVAQQIGRGVGGMVGMGAPTRRRPSSVVGPQPPIPAPPATYSPNDPDGEFSSSRPVAPPRQPVDEQQELGDLTGQQVDSTSTIGGAAASQAGSFQPRSPYIQRAEEYQREIDRMPMPPKTGLGRQLAGAAIQGAGMMMGPLSPVTRTLGQRVAYGDYPQRLQQWNANVNARKMAMEPALDVAEEERRVEAENRARSTSEAQLGLTAEQRRLTGAQIQSTIAGREADLPKTHRPWQPQGPMDAAPPSAIRDSKGQLWQPKSPTEMLVEGGHLQEVTPEVGRRLGVQPIDNRYYAAPSSINAASRPKEKPLSLAEQTAILEIAPKYGLRVSDPNRVTMDLVTIPNDLAKTAKARGEVLQRAEQLGKAPPSALQEALSLALLASRQSQLALSGERLKQLKARTGSEFIDGFVAQAMDDPDSAIDLASKLPTQESKTAFWTTLMRNGGAVPKYLDATGKHQVTVANTTLRHIDSIKQLINDPDLQGSMGPIMGRMTEAGQILGKSILKSGRAAQKEQKLLTLLNQTVAWEAKNLGGARPAWQLIQMLKTSSPNVKMDQDKVQGAIDGLQQSVVNVIQATVQPTREGMRTEPKEGAASGQGASSPSTAAPNIPPDVQRQVPAGARIARGRSNTPEAGKWFYSTGVDANGQPAWKEVPAQAAIAPPAGR
jgi:hypothetical protein